MSTKSCEEFRETNAVTDTRRRPAPDSSVGSSSVERYVRLNLSGVRAATRVRTASGREARLISQSEKVRTAWSVRRRIAEGARYAEPIAEEVGSPILHFLAIRTGQTLDKQQGRFRSAGQKLGETVSRGNGLDLLTSAFHCDATPHPKLSVKRGIREVHVNQRCGN